MIGVTARGCRILPTGAWGCTYHRQASLRPCHPSRVCRGAKPLCRESEGIPQFSSFLSPKNGGSKGVDCHNGAGTDEFRFSTPEPRLDSRLRGNDRGGCLLRASFKLVPTRVLRGVQRGSPPQADAGSLRVSLNHPFHSPKSGGKGVDKT
jgi:hypothetical protein